MQSVVYCSVQACVYMHALLKCYGTGGFLRMLEGGQEKYSVTPSTRIGKNQGENCSASLSLLELRPPVPYLTQDSIRKLITFFFLASIDEKKLLWICPPYQ